MNSLKKKVLAASLTAAISIPSLASAAVPPQESLVSLRTLGEQAGATVTWDQQTRTATVTLDGTIITVAQNSDYITVNGEKVPLPQKSQIIEDRLMVPPSVLHERLTNKKEQPKEENKNEKAATAFIESMQKGQFDKAVDTFSADLLKVMDAERMKKYWSVLPEQLNAGPLKEIGTAKTQSENAVHITVEVPLVFEKATVPFTIKLDKQGKINDFLLSLMPPAQQVAEEPTYSKNDAYTEKEVIVGDGAFALSGTLTMPKGEGPFPAIVLVQGSGSLDQDETTFALKPFRDLAHGLASQNIAVLRYNKRTFEHTAKTMFDPQHTVDKETTDDALHAVDLLANTKGIDTNRIYVLGHSQGGMMLPRILDKGADKPIAGGISMAGPAHTLPDIMLDQFDYLASLGQLPKDQLETLKKQIELLKDPNFSGENPPKEFDMGQPAFWDSIRNIEAAKMAKDQTKPLLILQGERDYQVKADTEYTTWKEELAKRDNVTYKLYPKLNHFFTEGEGKISKPEEYMTPANVPAYVINDIAAWINTTKK
ncbi:stalk domain-containing protein [Aneurinibacillus migulanus]|uniref:stalk domain-containing protein n=1 Tax=Aneurinibacillus migulanus TaxID=47500 RepID=UPI0009BB99A3|nr:stalk domain-containing protein [Aneurinibacillus migulanus]